MPINQVKSTAECKLFLCLILIDRLFVCACVPACTPAPVCACVCLAACVCLLQAACQTDWLTSLFLFASLRVIREVECYYSYCYLISSTN